MSTPNSGSAGNGAGVERFDAHGNLGSMSEIQQQLTVLFRQMGQLASPSTDSLSGNGVQVDNDGDCDESSESIGVRPRVTGRLVAPTLATVPCGRTALAGSRGTAAITSLRGAVMREIPGTPVHSSEGTPKRFSMSSPPATSAGVNVSGDTTSPGASVESLPSVSEGDEADDSPLPKLGGRAAHELKWLGETRVVRQGRTH